MPEQLWFTELLNRYFGGIAASLLHMVGLQPKYANAPITDPVAMEILVVLVLLIFFLVVRASLSVEKPGGLQHLVEATDDYLAEQAHGELGHG
jgi:F-type H+-transporting ATPase subunit a